MSSPDLAHADMSVRAAFWIVAVTAMAHLGWAFLSQNESWLAPVVRDVRVTSVEREADAITLSGDFRLGRSCPFLDASVHVGDALLPSAERERLPFRVLPGARAVGGPAPDGTVAWGPWRIQRPQTPAGPHLFVKISYRCKGMPASTAIVILGDADALFGR